MVLLIFCLFCFSLFFCLLASVFVFLFFLFYFLKLHFPRRKIAKRSLHFSLCRFLCVCVSCLVPLIILINSSAFFSRAHIVFPPMPPNAWLFRSKIASFQHVTSPLECPCGTTHDESTTWTWSQTHLIYSGLLNSAFQVKNCIKAKLIIILCCCITFVHNTTWAEQKHWEKWDKFESLITEFLYFYFLSAAAAENHLQEFYLGFLFSLSAIYKCF